MTKRLPLVIIIFIGIFYWPIAIIWAICYGSIGGFIFKYLSCWYEYYLVDLKQNFFEWRRYPKRHRKKHIDWLVAHEKTKKESDKNYSPKPREYFEERVSDNPITILFPVVMGGIQEFFITIVRAFGGMVEGTMLACTDVWEFWRIKILKRNPYEKYEKMLDALHKINAERYDSEHWNSHFSGF